jgi:hypothetical protein
MILLGRAPNKSLDASGGSVFLNLFGAAEGALIRAAASTQPLGIFLCEATMNKIFLSLLVFVALAPTLAFAQEPDSRAKPIAFSHITVVNVAATDSPHALMPDQTVIVNGNRIVAVGKGVSIPRAAQVIDATGKYLIPGLWDMHVHTGPKELFFPLYLANGVTGFRDMGGNLEQPTNLRDVSKEFYNLSKIEY